MKTFGDYIDYIEQQIDAVEARIVAHGAPRAGEYDVVLEDLVDVKLQLQEELYKLEVGMDAYGLCYLDRCVDF